MKNAYIILVSFINSVGLISGFVTPNGGASKGNSDTSSTTSIYYNESSDNSLNINKFNDSEVFVMAADKASNLSERSLIFINKKLKTLRRIPIKNRFQGYPALMSHNALNRWIVEENIPQKIVKGQRPENAKSVQGHLFDPNTDLKKAQVPTVYRYVYPDLPKRNKTCLYEEQQGNKPINETKTESSENLDPQLIVKLPVQNLETKSLDMYNNRIHKETSVTPDQHEQHSKNMVIKSYTNRKPKSNGQGCGFLKPSWLHRMTFNRNLEDKINQIDLSDTESNAYTEEKLDRYIKEALSELQIQIQKTENEMDDGKHQRIIKPHENKNTDISDKKLDELMTVMGVD